ncbi:hypothetical protein F8M41_020973 [Gigaspora margarita]|uniref:Uncharacterized protein n=1 Tax=Gigaspora margarita TaxID=4874 RepID=A0A8H4EJ98_GIGMA|nr:hypothetical protein F8M41_020973 [Gigaspora margarita]
MGSHKANKRETDNFCFCIGLRLGFIITGIIWMLEGFCLAIYFWHNYNYHNALNDNNGNNGNNDDSKKYGEWLFIILFGYSILLIVLSSFGLVSYRVYVRFFFHS